MAVDPPLVLMHFFGSSHREWDQVRARLAPDRRVLALDLPGFGDAAGRSPEDVAGMADDVQRAIAVAALASCVLVGHSMSGKVAAVLAAREPAWLRGLVLVTASPPSPEPMTDDAKAKLLAFDGSREAAADYVDGITASRLPDDLRNLAIDDAMRASLAAWKAWVTGGSQENWAPRVGVLGVPTHVIAGADDPSLGERIQRDRVLPHFPEAKLVVIDGGHALPLENPDGLHREIASFAARLASSFSSRRSFA